jgi:hypothetical protein
MRVKHLHLLLTIIFLTWGLTALAQDAPDYTVFSTAPILADDGVTLETELSVFNGGAAATEAAVLELRVFGEDTVLASDEVPPLAANASASIALEFPLEDLGTDVGGQQVVLEIRLSSDEIDPVQRLIEFEAPESTGSTSGGAVATPSTPNTEATPVRDETTADNLVTEETPVTGIPFIGDARTQLESWLSGLPFEVDLDNPFHASALAGVVLVLAILFWLLTVIMRLLFTSPPSFPNNPPPYANMPQLHPESLGGRRQMWQHVAQHGSMLADNVEGNLHVRKVLMGTDGRRYSGWKVVGIRASQYDTYGRVARTQVIARNPLLKRLSRATERSDSLDTQSARRRVRPVANEMARRLARKINRRSGSLPIAMDVKFRGPHGEVAIQFVLYQYQLGSWRQLDSWSPEMTVSGKAIYETYTFTIFGLQDGERMGQFRKRLREDMTTMLTEAVLCSAPPPPTAPTQANAPTPPQALNNAVPVQEDDGRWTSPTTSSMHPIPPNEDTDRADTPISWQGGNNTVDDSDMDTVARFRPKQ